MYSYPRFKENLETLQAKIHAVCKQIGRNPKEVKILPVTKNQCIKAMQYAAQANLYAIGENKVKEAQEKKKSCNISLQWELIGHLQTNKAKLAVELFDRIQSVDSEKLLRKINECAAAIKKSHYSILLQVNTGKDPAKFGLSEDAVRNVLEIALRECPNVKIEGFMTIAPLTEDDSILRTTFRRLKQLRDQLQNEYHVALPELSMGMSSDWQAAVEEGSTLLRIGSYLFGKRQ